MKIRQIRFRNINSFYGEHPPISFTEGLLATTGLFVIAGPTGAGKSTLLDVITLALFNRIPRLSGAISLAAIVEGGLVVNQQAAREPGTAAYAEVDYEVNNQCYRSRWWIKKNRTGNWNNYEMEVARLPEGDLFPIKELREFPKKNEELIGLTYEQFVRSIVLAQGAFDQFLKARAADRSKMLEKITGTEIYRILSQRVHQIERAFDEQISSKRKEVSLIQVLREDDADSLKQQQQTIEGRLKAIDQELDFYTQEQLLHRQLSEATKQLTALQEQHTLLAREQEAFADQAERLQRHELVTDLTTELSTLAMAEVNRQREAENQQKAHQELTRLNHQQVNLIAQAQQLTQQPNLTAMSFLRTIDTFRNQVMQLIRQIQEEQERVTRPFNAIQKTLEAAPSLGLQLLDPTGIDELIRRVADRKQAIGVDLAKVKREYPTLSPETIQANINQLIEQEQALTSLHSSLIRQQERLDNGVELNKKISQQTAFIDQQRPTLAQLAAEISALEQQRVELEQRKIQFAQEANLDELRKALREGEPCLLCGSLDHPYARHYISQTGQLEVALRLATEDVQVKKKHYDDVLNRVIQAESDRSAYTRQRDELRTLYSEKRNEITTHLIALALDPQLTAEQINDIHQLTQLKRKEYTLLQGAWEQEKILQRLAEDVQAIQEGREKTQRLILEKERLFPGEAIQDTCDKLTENYNQVLSQVATQEGLLKRAVDAEATFEQQQQSLNRMLAPILQERGLSDAAAARSYLLDTPTVRRLQEQKSHLQQKAHDISRKQAEETGKYQTALQKLKIDSLPDTVAQKLQELKAEQHQALERLGHVKNQLEQNKAEKERQKTLTNELLQVENDAHPWRELNRLIGSSRGDEFSKFAQGLTLTQLIGLANRRLRDLTDRYLLLKPRDGQEELYVVDQYQGSTDRSVSSLSGGETFTLSLALALALSDLASQRTQIDSLFIDEGFGTLDPETLDTAIAMLEKLQHDSKKTIGIISHRHEIKERISIQIQVEKGADGNSKVQIVEM